MKCSRREDVLKRLSVHTRKRRRRRRLWKKVYTRRQRRVMRAATRRLA